MGENARRVRTGVTVVLVATVLAACGSDDVRYGVTGSDVSLVEAELPSTLLGLRLEREDVSEAVSAIDDTYVDALSLYSLRQGELLQATLQISRFSDAADHRSPEFRRLLVERLGGTRPREVRIGDHRVWLTSSAKQRLGIWFTTEHFFVLAVRSDHPQPRRLLRAALGARA